MGVSGCATQSCIVSGCGCPEQRTGQGRIRLARVLCVRDQPDTASSVPSAPTSSVGAP